MRLDNISMNNLPVEKNFKHLSMTLDIGFFFEWFKKI